MSKARLLYLIPLLILLLLALFLWKGLSLNPSLLPSALINKPVPSFSLPTLQEPHKLFTQQDLNGKVSLLNIWASWCISCQQEHPILMDIAKNKHIPIYGLDYKDTRSSATHWLNQYGNPYQAIGFDQNGTTAINFGVYGTPETFIIDQHGIIRYKYIGPITLDVWNHELKPEITTLEQSG